MVASRLFAQVEAEGGEKSDALPVAVHKAAITAQISKVFGALFDETAPHFSGSWLVDLLVQLGDLGDIGHGYYIPRESRIVRLTSKWGRIAGGLPVELSEHPDEGVQFVLDETVGRLVKLRESFAKHDHGTEHSEVYKWQTNTVEQIHAELCEGLPERAASRPPEEATEFYNAGFGRGRTRGERWHKKIPAEAFVVARTGTLPTHYYILGTNATHRGKVWFEVEKEQARWWILLVEKRAGATNLIRTSTSDKGERFILPNMLPGAWTTAIQACASTVTPVEKGWTLEIQPEARELLETLLRGANILLI
jgi:hypothetical protein